MVNKEIIVSDIQKSLNNSVCEDAGIIPVSIEVGIIEIGAMNPDLVIIRHNEDNSAEKISNLLECPVINAGEGVNEHPTQALLDAFTILSHKKTLKDLTVSICGDLEHSRVARSNYYLLTKMGSSVRFVYPKYFEPSDLNKYKVETFNDLNKGIESLAKARKVNLKDLVDKTNKNPANKNLGVKKIDTDTDVKTEEVISEVKDKKGKGSGSKDACYHKVKSRYSVWPSAYASGALVKCRKVGAANWGNSKKEEFEIEAVDGKFMPSNPKFRGAGNIKNYDPKEPNGPASNNLINTFTQTGRKFGDYVSDKIEKSIDTALKYLSKPMPCP